MKKKLVDKEVIRKVAELAKLTLNNSETVKFEGQLSKVFDYVNLVSQLETKYASETSQMVYKPNKFREDVVNKELMFSQEEATSQAKRKYKGFFVTNSVLG